MLQVPRVYCVLIQNHFPQFSCAPCILLFSLSFHEPQQEYFKFLNHHCHILKLYKKKKKKNLFGAIATYRWNLDGGKFHKLWLAYWTNKHEAQCWENCMLSTKLNCQKLITLYYRLGNISTTENDKSLIFFSSFFFCFFPPRQGFSA